jgi:hypothetical protein
MPLQRVSELNDVRELAADELGVICGRSAPNCKTDIIKAMENTKWGDVELK